MENVKVLPYEETIWTIRTSRNSEDHAPIQCGQQVYVQDRAGVILASTLRDQAENDVSYQQLGFDLLMQCALSPLEGPPRRPRYVRFQEGFIERDIQQKLKDVGVSCVDAVQSGDSLGTTGAPQVLRECSHCHRKGSKDMFKKCSGCRAMYYCTRRCQKRAWSGEGGHKLMCPQMKDHMKQTNELADLPFTFAIETTSADFSPAKYKLFLESQGVWAQGLWRTECASLLPVDCRASRYGDLDLDGDPIVLPIESILLEEDPETRVPQERPLQDWTSYYSWRGFRLDSPIAILLHVPLTLYYIITTYLPTHYPGTIPLIEEDEDLVIHLIGVEKEADLLPVCKELSCLLPDVYFDIHMFGPEISRHLDGRTEDLGKVKVMRHSKLYHKYEGRTPSLAIGLNCGLGAYRSWAPTLLKLKEEGVASVFTDYCQLSYEYAQDAIRPLSTLGSLSPPAINPFRCPVRRFCEEHDLPWYSNAFIFHLQDHLPENEPVER